MGKVSSQTKYIAGIDESNHGKSPEYFVAVVSRRIKADSKIYDHMQRITDWEKLREVLNCPDRDFRYLTVEKETLDSYKRCDLVTDVYSQLIDSFHLDPHFLKVCIDGELRKSHKVLIEEEISRGSGICPQKIAVIGIQKNGTASTNFVISLADSLASYCFRKRLADRDNILKEITKDPKGQGRFLEEILHNEVQFIPKALAA
ncbi:MAG: hypothetical protein ABIH72_04910 [archaeon]